jgi:hypothetical protein
MNVLATLTKNRLAQAALFLAVLIWGVSLRLGDLASTPLWVDEAESSINALTILDHGYPVDHYLEMPIYENTLTRPWPESAEYEFKDSSYSARGMAIYHGWLPLYSIAASFALAGIEPDRRTDAPAVQYSREEMKRRTFYARLPAVIYAALFLLVVAWTARQVYGNDAGWIALLLASLSKTYIWLGSQARYYSPTLALSAVCGLAVWLMVRKGQWKHFVLGGFAFVLLFHTHMMSFAALSGLLAIMAPFVFRHQRAFTKLAVFGTIVTAGVLPWLIMTGFLGEVSGIPRAREIFSVPYLVVVFLRKPHSLSLPIIVGLTWLAVAWLLQSRLPERLTKPFLSDRFAYFFFSAWILVYFLLFNFTIPAASYYYMRLILGLIPAGIVLASIVLAGFSRVLVPGRSVWAGAALVAIFFSFWGRAEPAGRGKTPPLQYGSYEMVETLRDLTFQPGTRIYATPNEHLTLTFYTGMPIQSVAPVRASFLDSLEGELVILECVGRYGGREVEESEVRELAEAAGQHLSEAEAWFWAYRLGSILTVRDVAGFVRSFAQPETSAPDFLEPALQLQRERAAEALGVKLQDPTGHFMAYGSGISDYSEYWPMFFYRFVEPKERSGSKANFRARVRHADAQVLPISSWVIYRCPPLGEEESQPLRLTTATEGARPLGSQPQGVPGRAELSAISDQLTESMPKLQN